MSSPRGGIVVDDDPLALAQRRVWEAQKIVAEQKKRLFVEHRDALLAVKRRRQ
jgi:hypothetical protein